MSAARPEQSADSRRQPVFDEASALARTGGNAELLYRLLDRFNREYAGTATALRHAIERGDFASARRDAHTLKGVASNLSLLEVQASTAALEHALRDERPEEAMATIDRVEAALRAAADPLWKRSGSAVADPKLTPERMAEFGKELLNLRALLERHSMRSRAEVRRLREERGAALVTGELAEIAACLDQLDFRSARSVLSGVMERLGVTVTEGTGQ